MSKRIIVAWIVVALVCIIGIASFLLLRSTDITDPVAEIYLDGKLYRTVSLSEDAEFTVTSEYGSNTINVQDNSIAVIAADCPDKVCVSSGAISGGVVPIICLPHRLEIRIASATENDIDIQIR